MSKHLEIKTPEDGCNFVNRFQVIDTDTRPSWKRYGRGSSFFQIQTHAEAGWIHGIVRETPEGRRGQKEVYFNLSHEHAIALRDFLNQTLPCEKPSGFAKFTCPKCGGDHFGSSGENAEVAHCHDQFNAGCRWSGTRKEAGLE